MQESKVRECHYLTYEGRDDVVVPIWVTAHYRLCDDGFVAIDYDPETLDYDCLGSC